MMVSYPRAKRVKRQVAQHTIGHVPVRFGNGLRRASAESFHVLRLPETRSFRRLWDQWLLPAGVSGALGLPPQRFVEALTGSFHEEYDSVAVPVRVDVQRDGHRGVSWRQFIVDDSGRVIATMTRKIFLDADDSAQRKTLYHDLMIQHPGAEAFRGLSRVMMRASYRLCRDLGIEWVKLKAGLTDGGGLWPRFGFRPATPQAWEAVKPKLLENFESLNDHNKSAFEDDLKEFLDSSDPRSIWNLADPIYWEDPTHWQDESRRHQTDWKDKALWCKGSNQQKPLSIGSRLLWESQWDGILDLRDGDAVDRLYSFARIT